MTNNDTQDLAKVIITRLDRLERIFSNGNSLATGGRLLSLKAAAEYLAVSTDTMRRRALRREISFVQDGRGAEIKFRMADLDQWVHTHTTKGFK